MLPELEATGLLPVEIQWLGRRICPPATLRVIPPGPSVPRIYSLSDGINQVAGTRIETRLVKMKIEEVARPHEIEASVGGHPVGSGFSVHGPEAAALRGRISAYPRRSAPVSMRWKCA